MSSIAITRDAYAHRVIKESWPTLVHDRPIPLPSDPSDSEPQPSPKSENDFALALQSFKDAFNVLNIGRQTEAPVPDPAVFPPPPPPPPPKPLRIGIIGAGAAGLYAAMILESLGISFEILEASDRVGGRLCTRKLGTGANEYYDAGAMRFPKNPLMDRTFDLFRQLEITTDNGKLVEYHMSTENDRCLYNDTSAPASSLAAGSRDVFRFRQGHGGNVPKRYFRKGYDYWIKQKIEWLRDALREDFRVYGKGWEALMSVDRYSMRTYMSLSDTDPSGETYPNSVIDWCETLGNGTGMYDTALSGAVIGSLEFDYNKGVPWYCVQGGAEEIAKAMAKSLDSSNQPIMKKRVTAMYPVMESDWSVDNVIIKPAPIETASASVLPPPPPKFNLAVEVEGESQARVYDHVISTIPLGAMRLVDTSDCFLSHALKDAIRTLRYEASVKVAIKFTKRWWEEPPYNQKGGASKTDRPTRVVVYPSYGIGGSDAVLLVSYTLSQDALRFGALVQGNDSQAEAILIKVILKDISDIHNIELSDLKDMYVSHDAWDWYHNEYSCGAFALFGPGQFRYVYPEVTRPAAFGLLHFAGEATSTNHAWVVGALNSAFRCVQEILVYNLFHEELSLLQAKWGDVGEVHFRSLVKQVILGVHESTKLANKVEIE